MYICTVCLITSISYETLILLDKVIRYKNICMVWNSKYNIQISRFVKKYELQTIFILENSNNCYADKSFKKVLRANVKSLFRFYRIQKMAVLIKLYGKNLNTFDFGRHL